jgi:hypothetical protein
MAKSRLYEMVGDLSDVNGSQRSLPTTRDPTVDGWRLLPRLRKNLMASRIWIFENLNQGSG